MWVKVIKKFTDKYTGKKHPVGEKLNLKRERIDEILAVGPFVEVIKNDKETSK